MFFAVDGFLTQGTSEKKKKKTHENHVCFEQIYTVFFCQISRQSQVLDVYYIYIYIFRMKINIEIKMNHDPAQYKLHV